MHPVSSCGCGRGRRSVCGCRCPWACEHTAGLDWTTHRARRRVAHHNTRLTTPTLDGARSHAAVLFRSRCCVVLFGALHVPAASHLERNYILSTRLIDQVDDEAVGCLHCAPSTNNRDRYGVRGAMWVGYIWNNLAKNDGADNTKTKNIFHLLQYLNSVRYEAFL